MPGQKTFVDKITQYPQNRYSHTHDVPITPIAVELDAAGEASKSSSPRTRTPPISKHDAVDAIVKRSRETAIRHWGSFNIRERQIPLGFRNNHRNVQHTGQMILAYLEKKPPVAIFRLASPVPHNRYTARPIRFAYPSKSKAC